jgi:hypothetical protein
MSEQLPTDHHYDVLNAVVLKQMSGAASVGEATGIEVSAVESVLEQLSGSGLVFLMDGSALPGAGAVEALSEVADARYVSLRADAAVLEEVDRFEETNTALLTAMTQWQAVEVGGTTVPNDHSDAEYDDKVLRKIDRLTRKLDPLLAAMSVHDPRFGIYQRRFEGALERVDAGEIEYVSSPLHDSVHTIWFEFHEDLLRATGRQRVQ